MVSDVKSEIDDVAFLYAVVLAFEAPFARFFCARFAVVADEVVVGDDFGADEAAFKVVDTDPGLRGDTSGGGGKPATLETGAVVRVPLFMNIGDVIRVDTRSGEYLGRAKE